MNQQQLIKCRPEGLDPNLRISKLTVTMVSSLTLIELSEIISFIKAILVTPYFSHKNLS